MWLKGLCEYLSRIGGCGGRGCVIKRGYSLSKVGDVVEGPV